MTTMQREDGTFMGAGGLRIHWRAWLPSQSVLRGQMVVAHGVGEHGDRYERLAEALAPIGVATWVPDHRGHGDSEGPRGLVDRLANVVADMDTVVEVARRDSPEVPVFMFGHSMGGAVALSYALEHQDKLAGIVLSAPAAALEDDSAVQRLGARVASEVIPRVRVHKLDLSGISRDPEEVRMYNADERIDHEPMRARTVGELVRAFGRFRNELPRLRLPLLILHGTADRLTTPAGSKLVAERAGSADKELKLYDGFYHELINEPEPDRERVLAEIRGWVEARL
jgi:lysophospholipase